MLRKVIWKVEKELIFHFIVVFLCEGKLLYFYVTWKPKQNFMPNLTQLPKISFHKPIKKKMKEQSC